PDYLLQRINHYVFKDVDALMQNLKIVTEHLKNKIDSQDAKYDRKEVLSLVDTKDGKLYYKDEENNYWRILVLIDNMKSYDIVETESQARERGRAFGEFQSQLSDLDSSLLKYTIPNFCNIEFRMANVHKALKNDVASRVAKVAQEIDYILKREHKMNTILQ